MWIQIRPIFLGSDLGPKELTDMIATKIDNQGQSQNVFIVSPEIVAYLLCCEDM